MKSSSERPYIDFYKKHKISPVAQNIANLNKHYERREYLYRRLGIVASFLKGKTVIEFGPGSGHNSLYTYSLQPSRYVLVDGNPTGLRECDKLLTEYFPHNRRYDLVESLIEEYSCNELFDLVLCEGLIPAQKDPAQFLTMISGFTKPGGVCVITCHDNVSHFTELLRALIGSIFIREGMSLQEMISILVPVFEKHLINLKGMTRSYEDWVVDNIIHSSLWRDSNFFSIKSAISAIDAFFDVYGSSPYFFSDWRWYKDVHGESKMINEFAIDCYHRNIHNLLDCRYVFEQRAYEDNDRIIRCCSEIQQLIASYGHEKKDRYIFEICQKLNKLESIIRRFSASTADSLLDFINTLAKYPAISPETDWGKFAQWWGRGMQYLSFIRNKK